MGQPYEFVLYNEIYFLPQKLHESVEVHMYMCIYLLLPAVVVYDLENLTKYIAAFAGVYSTLNYFLCTPNLPTHYNHCISNNSKSIYNAPGEPTHCLIVGAPVSDTNLILANHAGAVYVYAVDDVISQGSAVSHLAKVDGDVTNGRFGAAAQVITGNDGNVLAVGSTR